MTAVTAGDGTRLAVRRRHGSRLPRFLLVHGLASNARLWDGVAAELAAAGHPSTAVDLRGHGESDRPQHGYEFPTLVSDLAAVIAADDDGPVVAVGQSFGGNLVLDLAHRHPERVSAVACVDGGFIRLADRFPDWESAAAALAPPSFDGLTRRQLEQGMRARFDGWPEEAVAAQLANFEDTSDGVRPRLHRSTHMRLLSALWTHDSSAIADRLELPVLVVAATVDSPAEPGEVEAFVRRLRRGRLAWVEGHHDVHAQRPGAVAALLLELAGEVER